MEPGAEYSVWKEAIFERFNVSPEASRIKLREASYDLEEDPGDLMVRLRTLAIRWLMPPSNAVGSGCTVKEEQAEQP